MGLQNRGGRRVNTEFPSSIGRVAPRSLAEEGITTYAQLASHTEKELLEIHGVGPKAIRILGEELRERGMAYRTEISGTSGIHRR